MPKILGRVSALEVGVFSDCFFIRLIFFGMYHMGVIEFRYEVLEKF